jgi:hypothetical protein
MFKARLPAFQIHHTVSNYTIFKQGYQPFLYATPLQICPIFKKGYQSIHHTVANLPHLSAKLPGFSIH